MGLGRCCGDPASCGRSGLASETIIKAPLGQLLSQRPQGPFFLLRGPSLACWASPARSAFPPEGQPLTCRRHSTCFGGTAKAVVPCEWSQLVRRSSLGMPLSPLEVIGSASFIPGLCPIAASDPAIWISLLYPWAFPGWSAMSLGIRYSPIPHTKSRGVDAYTSVYLVAGDATGDVNGRGIRVFDISQKLFLGVKSRPGL